MREQLQAAIDAFNAADRFRSDKKAFKSEEGYWAFKDLVENLDSLCEEFLCPIGVEKEGENVIKLDCLRADVKFHLRFDHPEIKFQTPPLQGAGAWGYDTSITAKVAVRPVVLATEPRAIGWLVKGTWLSSEDAAAAILTHVMARCTAKIRSK